MRLFVGSLPFETADKDLQDLFGAFGVVRSARIITDRETGRSRGFGFVDFTSASEAKQAMASLDGYAYEGRTLSVKEAEDRRPNNGAPRSAQQPYQGSGPQVVYKGRSNGGPPPPAEIPKKKNKGGRKRQRGFDSYDDWS